MKRVIFGLVFDPATGRVEYEDGGDQNWDFTFENYTTFNPLQFATEYTTKRLVEIISPAFPQIKFKPVLISHVGPWLPPAWHLEAERDGIKEQFRAGLIANSIIRRNNLDSFKDELKMAGLLF